MHEFSLAESVMELVGRHRPPGTVVRIVRLRAGPLRGVDPIAMQTAWRATTAGTELEPAALEIEFPPWRLRCLPCADQWNAAVWDAPEWPASCPRCGRPAEPVGGDELTVTSLEVDDDAGACGRERPEAQR